MAVFGPDDPATPFTTNPAAPGTYYVHMWSANSGSSIVPYEFNTHLEWDSSIFLDGFESGSTSEWTTAVK